MYISMLQTGQYGLDVRPLTRMCHQVWTIMTKFKTQTNAYI